MCTCACTGARRLPETGAPAHHGALAWRVLQYPPSCALSVRAGTRPCVPQGACSTGATVLAELRAAGTLWHPLPHASARHCAHLGTNSAGATVLAECAPAERIGCFPQLPMASPLAPFMLHEDNSAPTSRRLLIKEHIIAKMQRPFGETVEGLNPPANL